MEITSLMPNTEVYFEHEGNIKMGIFKAIQKTNKGKLVKNRNRIIEIINKKGNVSTIIISKEIKLFNSRESLIEYKEDLLIENKKKQELLQKEYNEKLNKIKDSLFKIENINQLPIYNDCNEYIWEYYAELFDNEFSFSLQDGTKVKMTKYEYQCILHDLSQCEEADIYKIDDELFMCFDCGTLLVNRDDLVGKYNDEIVDERYLFPKQWSESRTIEWIKRRK